MRISGLAAALAAGCAAAWAGAQPAAPSAAEIIRRSVVNNDRNWKEAPQFTFFERDVTTKSGKKTDRTYENVMIDGSPYQKLVGINGEPLPPHKARVEERKFKRAILRRQHESTSARQTRVQDYENGRRQDHELMQQMTAAFDYKLLGEETVNGRECYVLEGNPRPDYKPINRDTEVLKGMRGKLWVDKSDFQWVKVHAEVFRPVTFGLFIAEVEPGTQFTLEEQPIGDGLWMPSKFGQEVKSQVLWFWSHNSSEHVTYWGYQRQQPAQLQAATTR